MDGWMDGGRVHVDEKEMEKCQLNRLTKQWDV